MSRTPKLTFEALGVSATFFAWPSHRGELLGNTWLVGAALAGAARPVRPASDAAATAATIMGRERDEEPRTYASDKG